ncbi:MAG: enoyl-CoA hydratase/isomerase family protein [Candidatus Delongbacteria bacterium]|nr:enoyl-CoA hydratase/isomerase family protein [bacterium]MBL7033789.1 enoyl-CoA hydratase/isomerase family protein [Candidatus Delongbacteria bacterium]
MTDKVLSQELFDGQVVRVTLNAPKGNILDGEMTAGIQEVLDSLQNQPRVKLLQFTGAGNHFCFGASVPEHTRSRVGEMLKNFHRLFHTLVRLQIPSAALVSGQCLGGGLELALMCNFLFLDDSARLGQPEVALGVFAPPASLILPQKIGQAAADDLLLTGRIIQAEEARQLRLTTGIFADREALLTGVDSWTEQYILPRSASSLKYAVKAARWKFNRVLKKQLDRIEQFYTEELMATPDANEGITAFLEKRSPEWEV